MPMLRCVNPIDGPGRRHPPQFCAGGRQRKTPAALGMRPAARADRSDPAVSARAGDERSARKKVGGAGSTATATGSERLSRPRPSRATARPLPLPLPPLAPASPSRWRRPRSLSRAFRRRRGAAHNHVPKPPLACLLHFPDGRRRAAIVPLRSRRSRAIRTCRHA